MSELKKCPFCSGESIVVKTAKCGRYIACWDCGRRTEEFETDYAGSARDKAVAAWNRRAKSANEPLTQPEDQWMETASDNTDCVLAYADGIYCMTDADGHVICEFIRKPEPEGREKK